MASQPIAEAGRPSIPATTFILSIDEARRKAREIINQPSKSPLTAVIENWRQLSNGQIEFTVRHLPGSVQSR